MVAPRINCSSPPTIQGTIIAGPNWLIPSGSVSSNVEPTAIMLNCTAKLKKNPTDRRSSCGYPSAESSSSAMSTVTGRVVSSGVLDMRYLVLRCGADCLTPASTTPDGRDDVHSGYHRRRAARARPCECDPKPDDRDSPHPLGRAAGVSQRPGFGPAADPPRPPFPQGRRLQVVGT